MDAVKFLKENRRMCEKRKCSDCPVSHYLNKMGKWCDDFKKNHPEQYVEIVEKWSAEHPAKTRQSEFLKMFPKVEMSRGTISILPCILDKDYGEKCDETDCFSCWKEYWFTEVE